MQPPCQDSLLTSTPTLRFRSRKIKSSSLSQILERVSTSGCGYRLTRPTPVVDLAWSTERSQVTKSFNNLRVSGSIASDDAVSVESEHCPSYKPNSVLKTLRRNSTALGAGCTNPIKTNSSWRKYGDHFSKQPWICDVTHTADMSAWQCRNQTLQSAPQKLSSMKTRISS